MLLALAGCTAGHAGDEARPDAPAASTAPATGDTAAPAALPVDTPQPPPWSAERFEAQPHMDWLRRHTPPELGYAPATTPWRRLEPHLAERLADARLGGAASPAALLAELALALGWGDELGEGVWEQTIRIRPEADDRALAIVLHWGLQDDAVAGVDLRVRLRADDGVWHIERVEQRFHCSRGVTPEGTCV
jgi:hypothetical protein